MEKITKDKVDDLIASCDSFVAKNNTTNMRERYVIYKNNKFTCIEGNTCGWYLNENETFSKAIRWMVRA